MKQHMLCDENLQKVNGGTDCLPEEITLEKRQIADLVYDAKNKEGGNEDIWTKKIK